MDWLKILNNILKEDFNYDCFTCEYAHRDKHSRFVDRCSGFSNCGYVEFKGEIKLSLAELIRNLSKNLNNTNKDYVQGFNDVLLFVKIWNENE